MTSDDSFFEKKYPNLHEAERVIALEEEQYFLGKKISEDIKKSRIDENNQFEIDNYFELLPPGYLAAYYFYQDYLLNLEKSLTQGNEQSEKQTPITSETIARAIAESNTKHYSDSENPTLDELIVLWEKDKKSSMAKSSFAEYGRETRFFVRVVTEFNENKSPNIADLNVSMIRHYQEVFSKIPKSIKTAEKSIEQLISMVGVKKSKSTIKDTFQKVGGFIIWASKKGYPVQNNIHPVLTSVEKIKSDQKKHRVPFDDSDLKKLFISHYYTNGKFKRASEYWAPLIALYSGGTLAEIVQLYTEDVYRDDNSAYWVMDINDKDEKQLKTKDGRPRIVPVHPMLKKIGFIDFVDYQRKRKEIRLFPCEKRNGVGKFGAFSNRFRHYRDRVGAGPRNDNEFRDFHSFRHLVRTKLTELGKVGKKNERFDEGLIDDIIGHTSSERSMGKKVYTHTDLVKAKYNALKRLEYDLDISRIRKWNECVFYPKNIDYYN